MFNLYKVAWLATLVVVFEHMNKLEKEYLLLIRNTLMHQSHDDFELSKAQVARVFNVDKSTAGRILDFGEKSDKKTLKAMGKVLI